MMAMHIIPTAGSMMDHIATLKVRNVKSSAGSLRLSTYIMRMITERPALDGVS